MISISESISQLRIRLRNPRTHISEEKRKEVPLFNNATAEALNPRNTSHTTSEATTDFSGASDEEEKEAINYAANVLCSLFFKPQDHHNQEVAEEQTATKRRKL